MKVLLSNDDSIYAPGLRVLNNLFLDMGHHVNIVAPEHQQSGTSHAITLHTALITKKIYLGGKFYGIGVNGFPADCVRLGITEIYPDTELVITGINQGNNMGPAVYYSGTVAAAFEGWLFGHRAIAFSLDSSSESSMERLFNNLKPFMPLILDACREQYLYNVNIPDISEIKGIKVTRQARSYFRDKYEKRFDPMDREYYWLRAHGFSEEVYEPKRPCLDDISALQKGYISITPLQFDLTNYEEMDLLEQRLQKNAFAPALNEEEPKNRKKVKKS